MSKIQEAYQGCGQSLMKENCENDREVTVGNEAAAEADDANKAGAFRYTAYYIGNHVFFQISYSKNRCIGYLNVLHVTRADSTRKLR